jgi:hypothetical protein
MIDPKRHADSRNFIESILRHIPGFRGYLERDYRQESDHLTRTFMADRLQRCKRAWDEYVLTLVDAGLLDRLPACERVKTRIDTLMLKIRGAVRGYSGFFDYVRVDENVLDQVYENDMALVQEVEALAASIEQLPSKPDTAASTPADLLRQLDELDRKFAKRGELLKGLGS